MKGVESAIQVQVESMVATNILFKFLNDESITATERLSRFAPCFANFVLGFQNPQLMVLKYPAAEAKLDRIERAINAICIEDSNHWPWLLTYLKTLACNMSRLINSNKKVFGTVSK